MDEEDTYYQTHHKNFYDTYKHEAPISDRFKRKITTLLKSITQSKGYISYGVTDGVAAKNDDEIFITSRPKNPPDMKKRYAGLLSMTLSTAQSPLSRNKIRDATEQGGHWGAWVYTPEEGVTVWDSMSGGERRSSTYTLLFMLFVVQIFKYNPDLQFKSIVDCQTCVRPAYPIRQLTGGFIQPLNGWNLNENIKRNEPIEAPMQNYAMGYNSQHQYCFAEALMFIEDHLNKKSRECRNSRDSLEVIKKYIYNKLNRPKEFNNFLYTYNPITRNRNRISMT
tara:strand:- start:1232 stop:2071 length:840 start_codon:yes stop_codon:yes gene_type:complete